MIDVTVPLSNFDPRLHAYQEKLISIYTQQNYESQEASICLPKDELMLKAIEQVREGLGNKLRAVIVIGIGGSNLGTRAIYDAGLSTSCPLLFLDTTDSWTMNQVLNTITQLQLRSWEEIAVLCVSKSGTTTETVANFSVLLPQLSQSFGTIKASQIVVIANEQSAAHSFATQSSYQFLSIPSQVGGRFSVLSSVGLLPLVLAGIEITSLQKGAANQLVSDCLPSSAAARYASFLFAQMQEGKTIHDFFIFEPRLENIGKWLRQLYAESLGKEGKGMLPTVSIGSNDLHSVVQYYLGGKIDAVTSFISLTGSQDFNTSTVGEELAEGIAGKSLNQIKEAILQAVKTTYAHKNKPFASLHLSSLTAESIGAFLQFHMTTVMMLGHLMEIDTFNQPNVEDYKKELKEIL